MHTSVLTFDTLQYAKRLKQVGFTEEQAEIQAETFKERTEAIQDFIDDTLATKQDIVMLQKEINDVRNDLHREINNVETNLRKEINEMGYKLTIKLGGMMVACTAALGAFIGLIKFIH